MYLSISQPWQVSVDGPRSICGGTLIDERHVLTAAHCIKSPDGYTVTVGLHDKDGIHFMEQKISAAKIYVHEQYDNVTLANDIAILYLSKAVEVTDKVNFICLPGAEADIGANVYVCKKNLTFFLHMYFKRDRVSHCFFSFAAGWGHTAFNGSASSLLKQANLKVKNCGEFWAPSQFDTKKQICAGIVGSGSCNGDSGGPLMYNYNGQW
jgi:elastase-2